ncbi:MAG: hypothetical protein EBZ48_05745 [Proteobacteria bacterium]|nr:hypothetical protein [Pseudomonadota bacterium]
MVCALRPADMWRASWLRPFIRAPIAALVATLMWVLAWYSMRAEVSDIAVTVGDKTELHATLPVSYHGKRFAPPRRSASPLLKDPRARSVVQMELRRGFLAPTRFAVWADSCVTAAYTEVKRLDFSLLCPKGSDISVNLAELLTQSRTEISFELNSYRQDRAFALRPERDSWQGITCILLATIAVGLWGAWFAKSLSLKGIVAATVVWGFVLRTLYLCATPYWVRGHDTGGHIEYILYVLNHWSIPAPQDGWQFYQPPLYYWLAACLVRSLQAFGLTLTTALYGCQILAVCFSCITLLFGARLVDVLLPPEQSPNRILAFVSLAFFPGLVMHASRLSNEGLSHAVFMVTLWYLVRWLQSPSPRLALYLGFGLGLGMLVKSTTLVLIAIVAVVGLLAHRVPWRQRWGHGAVIAAASFLLCGWYLAIKVIAHRASAIVENAAQLPSRFDAPNTWSVLLSFNPWQIVQTPFFDPWSTTSRAQLYLESLFRSAFFSECVFKGSRRMAAQAILVGAMLMIPLVARGVYRACTHWRNQALIPGVTLLLLFGASLAYRISVPTTVTQDFRFISPIVMPLGYFLAHGVTFQRTVLSYVASAVSYCVLVCGALFLVSLLWLSAPLR